MTTGWTEVTQAALDHDLALVSSAIGLVARHGARRVLVAGLGSGREVLRPAQLLAARAGLRLTAVPTVDGDTIDLEVDRAGDR
jgi:hypothetical protein